MTSNPTGSRITRRTSVAALAAASLAMAATTARPAFAQDTDLAAHPMAGNWLVRTPDGSIGVAFFRPDGTFNFSNGGAVTVNPDGSFTYMSEQAGVWGPDPENERGVHFISVQSRFDAAGAYIGTWITDGYPSVSEDGLNLVDDWSRSFITLRDANDEVIDVLRNDSATTPPIIGVRLSVDGFQIPPVAAPPATPES